MQRWLFMSLFLLGCTDESRIVNDCQAVGNLVPLCGWQRPEDMELLPDGEHIIVSQMEEHHGAIAGSIALLRVSDLNKLRLDHTQVDVTQDWGSDQCNEPPPTNFAPHGIHLSKRVDQRWQLLVVNHGGREAVEFYEVLASDDGYRLLWKGCVEPPQGSFLNDVVAVTGGGFVTNHMFTKTDDRLGSLSFSEIKALLGFNPGHVLHWDGTTFTKLPGLAGRYNNGIEVSADGNTLFVNYWGDSKLVKYDLVTQTVLGEVEIVHPDNSQWNTAGQLLVASHNFSVADLYMCMTKKLRACPGEFSIVSVDPETLETTIILRHDGKPMGAATVALQVQDFLYIGSFIGDRIVRVPYIGNKVVLDSVAK
jgi:hypothetical protein